MQAMWWGVCRTIALSDKVILHQIGPLTLRDVTPLFRNIHFITIPGIRDYNSPVAPLQAYRPALGQLEKMSGKGQEQA
jgi:hypothetical protein